MRRFDRNQMFRRILRIMSAILLLDYRYKKLCWSTGGCTPNRPRMKPRINEWLYCKKVVLGKSTALASHFAIRDSLLPCFCAWKVGSFARNAPLSKTAHRFCRALTNYLRPALSRLFVKEFVDGLPVQTPLDQDNRYKKCIFSKRRGKSPAPHFIEMIPKNAHWTSDW